MVLLKWCLRVSFRWLRCLWSLVVVGFCGCELSVWRCLMRSLRVCRVFVLCSFFVILCVLWLIVGV